MIHFSFSSKAPVMPPFHFNKIIMWSRGRGEGGDRMCRKCGFSRRRFTPPIHHPPAWTLNISLPKTGDDFRRRVDRNNYGPLASTNSLTCPSSLCSVRQSSMLVRTQEVVSFSFDVLRTQVILACNITQIVYH